MNGNGTRSPDAIFADIEAIRSEMDTTLLAIEARLTPGQMVDQGLDYLRNSGGREFLGNLGTSVKTNPVPATLVGIGLVWLMATQQRASRPGQAGRVDYDRAGIRTAPGDYVGGDDSTASALRETAGDMKAKVGEMADRASDAAASARDKVTDAIDSARDTAAATAQRARDLASNTAQRARETYVRTADAARTQVDRVSSGYRQLMQEQPLALGAIGLGVGALLAALAPRTRKEDELMGDAADAVKQRAAEAGHEQLSRAGERMHAALDQTRDGAAQSRGASGTDVERHDPASTGASVPPLTGANMARPTGVRADDGPLDALDK